jgi:hypothetical protein
MSPIAEADGHNSRWLVGQPVPGMAAVVEDILVRSEDAVGQAVVAHELPRVFDRV